MEELSGDIINNEISRYLGFRDLGRYAQVNRRISRDTRNDLYSHRINQHVQNVVRIIVNYMIEGIKNLILMNWTEGLTHCFIDFHKNQYDFHKNNLVYRNISESEVIEILTNAIDNYSQFSLTFNKWTIERIPEVTSFFLHPRPGISIQSKDINLDPRINKKMVDIVNMRQFILALIDEGY